MKTKTTNCTLILGLLACGVAAQDYKQYFDGKDTLCKATSFNRSICVAIDPDSTNIWQIGMPQKTIFDAAATEPNVLVTDTSLVYPVGNTSTFQFTIVPWMNYGILAIQWKQKLDMDLGLDGGKIEFSTDAGTSWQNAFSNPNVYNFYGFATSNTVTLPNGDHAFSGKDSVWKDIWLCFSYSWIAKDSLVVRFTFMSDSVDNGREGWMIDNLLAHATIIHTVDEVKPEKYLSVFPNPAADIIHIETQKLPQYHIIEQMTLMSYTGQVVDEWRHIPTKYFIDTKKYADGLYYLSVKTNVKSETVPVTISHK